MHWIGAVSSGPEASSPGVASEPDVGWQIGKLAEWVGARGHKDLGDKKLWHATDSATEAVSWQNGKAPSRRSAGKWSTLAAEESGDDS